MSFARRSTVLAVALGLVGMASCAESSSFVGDYRDTSDAGEAPAFVADASDDAALPEGDSAVPMCVATECSFPYDTCNTPFKCATNLLTDDANCGACGNACPTSVKFGYLHMESRCDQGTCKLSCTTELGVTSSRTYADCNQLIDDGCEVNLTDDPNNCGTCGNKCAAGSKCRAGRCGCPQGFTECGDTCVDLKTSDANCGACGNVCPASDSYPPIPPEQQHMVYACSNGKCGQKICEPQVYSFMPKWQDCDGDLSNGCEVDVAANDPKNCGVCGETCAPDQQCGNVDYGNGRSNNCFCRPGETLCGGTLCVDVTTDASNCGYCWNECRFQLLGAEHANPTCRDGLCGIECVAGWANCDGLDANGCETELNVDPLHCGACGNQCDTAAGQPCVAGRCLEVACDGGTETTK